MSNAMDSSPEATTLKLRFRLKLPTLKQVKNAASVAWRWLKWPLAAALVVGVLVALYYIVPPILGALLGLVKVILQFVWAIIVICFSSLWACATYLYYGGATPTVVYEEWLFAETPLYWYDDYNWGQWTLDGIWVYLVGGLTAFSVIYPSGRSISKHLDVQARIKRDREAAEEKKKADRLETALKAEFDKGHQAGVCQERQFEHRALIHAYTPKMNLPAIQDGFKRIFWVRVCMDRNGLWPTQDRNIHWSDIQDLPEHAIGAPAYKLVSDKSGDSLAMMTVVYKMRTEPTPWQ